MIPFTADVELAASPTARFRYTIDAPGDVRFLDLHAPRHTGWDRGGEGPTKIVGFPAEGGEPHVIAPSAGSTPQFTRDTSRVWVQEGTSLHSLRWDGFEKREFVRV